MLIFKIGTCAALVLALSGCVQPDFSAGNARSYPESGPAWLDGIIHPAPHPTFGEQLAADAQKKQEEDAVQAAADQTKRDAVREEAARGYAENMREIRAQDIAKGYKDITIETFELDKKQFTEADKLVISGVYIAAGDTELLMNNPYFKPYPAIGLITERSPRDVRAKFLECRERPGHEGCDVTVIGYAADCTKTTEEGRASIDRCLYVTGMR